MAGPSGLSGDRRRGDRPISAVRQTQIDDGHGYIAVDEIRMSDQPPPAQSPTAAASADRA